MPELDAETKAIAEITGIVGSLEEDQRGRVFRYILDRFNIAGAPRAPKKPTGGSDAVLKDETSADFADFASLFDACDPKTDSLRALVAGYWLQVCQSGQTFDGQSANNELKHLGHPSTNITMALGTLIKQRPSLVLQLRKSGNTKQARKLYKITESGARKVQAMISGDEVIE